MGGGEKDLFVPSSNHPCNKLKAVNGRRGYGMEEKNQ